MTVESLKYLRRIPIEENGEALVRIADYAPLAVIRKDAEVVPLVRAQVALRLARATELLAKESIYLYVWHAYRSPEYQEKIYNMRRANLQALNASWPLNIVHRETNKTVAPLNPRVPPPHCTGAAIDVLPMRKGKFLDLDRLPPERWELAPTICSYVDRETQVLRKHLCSVLESTGFSNYPDEFWHYSYGDQAWAARTGEPRAIYGLIQS